MANYFDQFDTPKKDEWADFRLPAGYVLDKPQANYFDRFDNGPPEGFVLDQPSVAADVGRQAIAGPIRGVAGLPGILGDIQRYLDSIAASNPAVNQAALARMRAVPGGTMPTSAETIGAAERYGGFKLPEAETTPGRYVGAVGEFLPNMAGGPETLLAKLASRVAAPALASEAAGQATAGTAAEPWARIAAAVAGGAGGARVARPGALEAPTIGELKGASRAGYQAPEVAAVAIKPAAVSNLGTQIENDLVGAGFREKTTPKTFGVVGELDVPKGVQSVGVTDLDSARRALGVIAKEKDAIGGATAEATAASRAIGHLDDFLPNLRQTDLLAGDAQAANAILQEARGNWGAAKRAELVDTKLGNAELQAASTYGGGNINNATRQAFRPLLKNNAAGATGFSPEALDALRRVVEGGFVGNTARQLGRLAPVGPVGIGMHVAGAFSPAAPGTIPLAAAAYGAKKIGEAITRREVDRLSNILRSQSPLARQMPPAIAGTSPAISALVAALLARQPAPEIGRRRPDQYYGHPHP